MKDKLNRVDFRWYIVRTLPHQERKLAEMLEQYKEKAANILEVYCPTHTTVSVRRRGEEVPVPLFAGCVFVLSTRSAITVFMERHYSEGTLLYDFKKERRGRADLLTIPEEQMRMFKDFNENYAEHLVVLERPYSDYAFNSKSGEPNEIVRVIDGPLAGREGYIARFRRDKRLVFNMRSLEKGKDLAVSIPNIWDFHVVRLHNAEGDRLSVATEKGRAADLLIGMLQGCGYGERTLHMLYDMTDRLVTKPSFGTLCQYLNKNGDTVLSGCLARMSGDEAELILNLIRYECDNPGYVRENWNKLILRPFLTPTAGVEFEEGRDRAELSHEDFTEIIRKVDITEEVYYPTEEKDGTVTTTYYAHVGVLKNGEKDGYTVFANWDDFLGEYFLTAGKAHEKLVGGTVQTVRGEDKEGEKKEKLVDSFRNYAPTLYRILTDDGSSVKALQDFRVGDETLNVLAVTVTSGCLATAQDELTDTCVRICKEINTTTHLAVWRRYLRTVWLHQ